MLHHTGPDVRMLLVGEPDRRTGTFVAQSTIEARRESDATVLLIHGFNTAPWDAVKTYWTFKDNVLQAWPHSRPPHIVTVGWPGDIPYRNVPSMAMAVAPALADFIEELNPDGRKRTLYLVCHSMGCRFALEAIRDLQRRNTPKRPKALILFLMAAAVPVALCDEQGRLRTTADSATEIRIYHSDRDWVLHYLFPLGQTVSGDTHDRWPEAVGFKGNPEASWTEARRQFRSRMAGYGHGDYWGSLEIARELCASLDRSTAGRSLQLKARAIGGGPP